MMAGEEGAQLRANCLAHLIPSNGHMTHAIMNPVQRMPIGHSSDQCCARRRRGAQKEETEPVALLARGASKPGPNVPDNRAAREMFNAVFRAPTEGTGTKPLVPPERAPTINLGPN